jgi:DNA-binding response OmpR family regulator
LIILITDKKKRILIVDDEPDVALVLKQVLEANGFEADSYEDPRLALKSFRANTYDLLLLDIKMPDINGLDLYQGMKKIDDKATVCFLTASEMYYEKFRKEEPYSKLDKELFIAKPVGNEELIDHINKIIDNATSINRRPTLTLIF